MNEITQYIAFVVEAPIFKWILKKKNRKLIVENLKMIGAFTESPLGNIIFKGLNYTLCFFMALHSLLTAIIVTFKYDVKITLFVFSASMISILYLFYTTTQLQPTELKKKKSKK